LSLSAIYDTELLTFWFAFFVLPIGLIIRLLICTRWIAPTVQAFTPVAI